MIGSTSAQHFDGCDPDIRAFLDSITVGLRAALDGNLIGVYLHGSLAFGCFYRAKSDLDLLVVVRESLPPLQRRELAQLLLTFSDARPLAGDLELSVITERAVRTAVYPMQYELHFSETHRDAIRRDEIDYAADRTDPDLAAHLTVARTRGIALAGSPPASLFDEVPWQAYRDSILADFDWIVEDDNILASPYYGVLNCCRILQALRGGPGTVTSKEEGGEWALVHLPSAHHALILQALACYRSSEPAPASQRRTGGMEWDAGALRRFRETMKREVGSCR